MRLVAHSAKPPATLAHIQTPSAVPFHWSLTAGAIPMAGDRVGSPNCSSIKKWAIANQFIRTLCIFRKPRIASGTPPLLWKARLARFLSYRELSFEAVTATLVHKHRRYTGACADIGGRESRQRSKNAHFSIEIFRLYTTIWRVCVPWIAWQYIQSREWAGKFS